MIVKVYFCVSTLGGDADSDYLYVCPLFDKNRLWQTNAMSDSDSCGGTQPSANGAVHCPTCTGAQYADRIYSAKRTNFWEYACPYRFASGTATFGAGCGSGAVPGGGCSGAPKQRDATSIAGLRYTEPRSYAAYLAQQRQQRGSSRNDDSVGNAEESLPQVANTACIGCRACSIEPSCGDVEFGAGCGPQPLPLRRMRHNAQVFKPASSLPRLDRYQWGQAASLYAFDSEEEYREAYDAINNGRLPLRTRFHFQNPQEQQRLWYGVAPEARGNEPTPPTRVPCSDCEQVPVPYYRNYLDSRYACGCNQRQCERCAR